MKMRLLLLIMVVSTSFLISPTPARSDIPTRGLHYRELTHDGITRHFYLYSPGKKKIKGNAPVIVVLHGGGGTARGMIRFTGQSFNRLADDHGLFIIYPQGVGRSWNDGRRGEHSSKAVQQNVDDTGFITQLLNRLEKTLPVNPHRTYVTGISNGGFMALALACRLKDRIAGVAPVTASLSESIYPDCQFPATTSLILFNGTADPLVPYQGGDVTFLRKKRGKIISTEDTLKAWARKAGCSNQSEISRIPDMFDDGVTVDRIEYPECSENTTVVLYRFNGGGHTWPGGRQYLPVRIIGKVSKEITAAEEMWKYFSAYPRAD